MEDSNGIKKRKIDTLSETDLDEGAKDDVAVCYGNNIFNPEPGCKPLPFTCICYDGRFYTTDNCGQFIHTTEQNGPTLISCEVEEETQEVKYNVIKTLSESQVSMLENINDLNVINDLTKFNKSLYY